jgi:hypothetical protein
VKPHGLLISPASWQSASGLLCANQHRNKSYLRHQCIEFWIRARWKPAHNTGNKSRRRREQSTRTYNAQTVDVPSGDATDNVPTGYALDSGNPKILWLPAGQVSQRCRCAAPSAYTGGVSAANRARGDDFPRTTRPASPMDRRGVAARISEAGDRPGVSLRRATNYLTHLASRYILEIWKRTNLAFTVV